MKYLQYGVNYIINHQIRKKWTPLIAGLAVTDKCNLHCRHCRVTNRGIEDTRYEEIIDTIDTFYIEGGRNLYLEGGEPFIWRDGQYTLENIVEYAHAVGFLTVVIYTNGTIPLETSADTVFISIDGLQKTHDLLRGKSFDRIMGNIQASRHPSLFINHTINNYNKAQLKEFCEYMNKISQIQGIFFYFHTPYYGYDELYIEPVERKEILLWLLHNRKKYKLLNSRAGIKSALKNNWKRPLDICRVYEKGRLFTCCRYNGDPELCQNCGYLSYAEIDQTLKLKPSAILKAIKYY